MMSSLRMRFQQNVAPDVSVRQAFGLSEDCRNYMFSLKKQDISDDVSCSRIIIVHIARM